MSQQNKASLQIGQQNSQSNVRLEQKGTSIMRAGVTNQPLEKKATIPYIPPPRDTVKDVGLYRVKEGNNPDFRKNALLAATFGMIGIIHSILVRSRIY
jgi:hypothetical protein